MRRKASATQAIQVKAAQQALRYYFLQFSGILFRKPALYIAQPVGFTETSQDSLATQTERSNL
jgi:hypothetical protein